MIKIQMLQTATLLEVGDIVLFLTFGNLILVRLRRIRICIVFRCSDFKFWNVTCVNYACRALAKCKKWLFRIAAALIMVVLPIFCLKSRLGINLYINFRLAGAGIGEYRLDDITSQKKNRFKTHQKILNLSGTTGYPPRGLKISRSIRAGSLKGNIL